MRESSFERLLFVSWALHCSRSDALARLLGGDSRMIYVERLGSHYATVWLKYILQGWQTWRLLLRERPRTVMLMVPPILSCLPVYVYCRLFRSVYITDNHTAAFTMTRWKPLLFLNAWFYRRAATNIVTSSRLATELKSWGAPVTIIGDLPVPFDKVTKFPDTGRFTIAVICSFSPDEPLESIWQAARELPDVDFYVTGQLEDLAASYIRKTPPNMRLTGYLARAEYAGLIKASHAAMVLTTRDHTMQRGAYEAVSLGTPIITSDWPLLRETFSASGLFVDNSPRSIIAAVRRLQATWAEYKAAVETHRQERIKVWLAKKEELRAALAAIAVG